MGRSKGRAQQLSRIDKAIEAGVSRALAQMNGTPYAQTRRLDPNAAMGMGDLINALTTGAVPMPRNPLDMVAFGPNWALPTQPFDPSRRDTDRPEPRLNQYPVAWNIPGNGQRAIPWETLRAAADNVDIMRRCIEVRKEQMRGLKWAVTLDPDVVSAAYEADGTRGRMDVEAELRAKYLPEIQRCTEFWRKPWRTNGVDFGQWVNAFMEDHLVLDAVAIYPQMSYGGELLGLELIDGATIKPLLDYRGSRPRPPFPAFQQNLWGYPRSEFTSATVWDEQRGEVENPELGSDARLTADQLFYYRSNFRTTTPYGLSAVEQSLISARLYLKRQGWMLAEYDDGSTPLMWLVPEATAQVMDAMTPANRLEYERSINDKLTGNTAARHRIKLAPPGFNPIQMESVDERYKADYDLHLIKMLAGFFGVTATGLGFSESRGLGNSGLHEGQENVQDKATTEPDRQLLEAVFNELSHGPLRMPAELRVQFIDPDTEDSAAEDETADRQRRRGTITLNEDRKRLGLAPSDLAEADALMVEGGPGGWTPLDGMIERAEQTAANEQALVDQQMATDPDAMDSEAVDGGDVEKSVELAAYARWRRKRGDRVGRPFLCKSLEPDDFPAGVPGDVDFEQWAWVPDDASDEEITKALGGGNDNWRHLLRDRKGRWVKMGTHGPALPGKHVLAGLAEDAKRHRAEHDARHVQLRVNDASSSMGGMTTPKPMTQQRAAKAGDTKVTVSLKRGTKNSVEVKHDGVTQYTAYADDAAGMDAILDREVASLGAKVPQANPLDAARAELRDAEAAHAKTWGASERDKSLAAARVAHAQTALAEAERKAKAPAAAAPKPLELPTAPDKGASVAAHESHVAAVERALAAHYGADWENVELPDDQGKAYVAAVNAVGDARRREAAAVTRARAAHALGDHEDAVREAYRAAGGSGAPWVNLANLRDDLHSRGMSRGEQDAALAAMTLRRDAVLIPEENQKKITEADRAAALRLGGEDRHLISVERDSRAAAPTADVQAAQAKLDAARFDASLSHEDHQRAVADARAALDAAKTPKVAAPATRSVSNIDKAPPERQAALRETARKLDEQHAEFFPSNRAELERDMADERSYLARPDVTGDERKQHEAMLAGFETLAATPRGDAAVQATKGARELVELADRHGMIVMISHSSSNGAGGGSPYFEIQAVSPDMKNGFKATFHTFKGKNGSYGRMSSQSLKDGRWNDASLTGIREHVENAAKPVATVETAAPRNIDPSVPMPTADVREGDWRWHPTEGWQKIGLIEPPKPYAHRVIWGADRDTKLGTLPHGSTHIIARQDDKPTMPPRSEGLKGLQRKAGEPARRGDLYVVERTDNHYVGGGAAGRDRKTYEVHEVVSVTREGKPKTIRRLTSSPDGYATPVDKLGRAYGKASVIPGDRIDKEGLTADLRAYTYSNSTTPRHHEDLRELGNVLYGRMRSDEPAAAPEVPRVPKAKAAPNGFAKLLDQRDSDAYVTHAPSRRAFEAMRTGGWELSGARPGGAYDFTRGDERMTAVAPSGVGHKGNWTFWNGDRKLTYAAALEHAGSKPTTVAPTPAALKADTDAMLRSKKWEHGTVAHTDLKPGTRVHVGGRNFEVLGAGRKSRAAAGGTTYTARRDGGYGDETLTFRDGEQVNLAAPVAPKVSVPAQRMTAVKPKQMEADWSAHHATLNAGQRKAVHDYTTSDYFAINEALRGNQPKTARERKAVTAATEAISSAMAPAPNDTLTYRGTHTSSLGLPKQPTVEQMRALVGKTLVNDAFTSTSVDKREIFAGNLEMEIEVPRGTPSLYLGDAARVPTERELLLDKGARMRVDSVVESPKGSGNYKIKVRIV